MKCEKIESQLVDYLRRELDQEAVRQVEDHLVSCPHCRAAFRRLQVPWQALDEFPQLQPSAQSKEAFQRWLSEQGEPPVAVNKVREHKAGIGALFQRFWPSRPVWAVFYSLIMLFSGITAGQVLPQNTLPFVQAFNGSAGDLNSEFTGIPEDSLAQWCAVRSQQYPEVL